MGWGKLNRKCQVSNLFFGELHAEDAIFIYSPTSYKHVFGRDGGDIAFVKNL